MKNFLLMPVIFVSVLITGCASDYTTYQVYAPNEQLDEVLTRYVNIKALDLACSGKENQERSQLDCGDKIEPSPTVISQLTINLNCNDNNKPIVDCFELASELGALSLIYPNNMRILMASALVEFEIGNINSSQQLLDLILSRRGAYPEAAILRSRIAIEEGNLTLARSIVKRQLSITPYNPYLYQLQAAYYYIEGQYTQALQAIKSAEYFMRGDWRMSYHRGLIYEAQQQWYKACREYIGVLNVQPDNKVVNAKVLLLREHIGCYIS